MSAKTRIKVRNFKCFLFSLQWKFNRKNVIGFTKIKKKSAVVLLSLVFLLYLPNTLSITLFAEILLRRKFLWVTTTSLVWLSLGVTCWHFLQCTYSWAHLSVNKKKTSPSIGPSGNFVVNLASINWLSGNGCLNLATLFSMRTRSYFLQIETSLVHNSKFLNWNSSRANLTSYSQQSSSAFTFKKRL